MIIDIFDWDISYTDLMYWISQTGAEIHAITGLGNIYGGRGSPSTKYEFLNEEDYIAFTLSFQKDLRK